MRSYGIYKVKKEYEQFVIGREQLLYELLKRNDGQSEDLKEVHYLCDVLERQAIDDAIISKLGKVFETIERENGEYKLTHPVKGSILISISPYSLSVYCDGSRMLDLDLFVALSEAGDRFFAVMDGHGEWGWLKPIKFPDRRMETEAIFR
ncbi:sporulation inhibitor of replication protein SirA [Sporosarcina sp. G11-34]|uniref:sporulation inhibitor of replication protein SirA n=1 Tax=Sporosarcina sp. G11-34 TaxID=2849605 RepID=UPI0022A9EA43|nr:sporulation inhibitor of replication protein SirA [Sporosarcina sp. G11-34]MCZ2256977.1 sporulation inhibitor of replication protein SirA [Sporosarcina sp. G11-34]